MKVEPYGGHSSCLGAFPSNPKTSRIAAQLAYERQEPEDDGGEWIDETDNTKVKNKTTRVRASALGREIRNGRRTIKFLGGGVSKEKGDPSKDIKQIGQNETREGLVENDCASVLLPSLFIVSHANLLAQLNPAMTRNVILHS